MRKLTQRDSVLTAQSAMKPVTREWGKDAQRKTTADSSAAIEQDRKCASITIRVSKAECEQLKRRAADAGLSMSAYLRSCTFEAEALRAQVKEALAELRRANARRTSAPGIKSDPRVSPGCGGSGPNGTQVRASLEPDHSTSSTRHFKIASSRQIQDYRVVGARPPRSKQAHASR